MKFPVNAIPWLVFYLFIGDMGVSNLQNKDLVIKSSGPVVGAIMLVGITLIFIVRWKESGKPKTKMPDTDVAP